MALGGVVIDGRCVETALAPDFYYSTIPPNLFQNNLYSYQKIGGVWKFNVQNQATGFYISSSPAPFPVLPPCDPAAYFQSGLFLGSVVGSAFIMVSLTALLRRAL